MVVKPDVDAVNLMEKPDNNLPDIGILMTDSAFERFPGDIGNPVTWDFPVQYKTLSGVTPTEMMTLPDVNSLPVIIEAADELIHAGVRGITTTCGFLGLYQRELADHCPVPVATSSLLQVPIVKRLIASDKSVVVLTYDASALTVAHLNAVGVPIDTPIVGIDHQSVFYQWIMRGLKDIEFQALEADVLDCASLIRRQYPNAGAIVAECTNLTPFSSSIMKSTGLPVFDMMTLMRWFQGALKPLVFPR